MSYILTDASLGETPAPLLELLQEMNRTVLRLILCLLVLAVLLPGAQAASTPISERRVEELKQLRFGMFVCWSFSTFSGKEWTPGVTNISLFAAKDCDTDQWARTAKEAGMGYILFLTKHHDGFCLWDTKQTDYNIMNSPFKRDVVKELAEACRKGGIIFAFHDKNKFHFSTEGAGHLPPALYFL